MRTAYWFQNDLRLADNPGLLAAARVGTEVLCVYCRHDPRPWCNLRGKGPQRSRFELESLVSLDAALRQRGQRLLVLDGEPAQVLPVLIKTHQIRQLHLGREAGTDEAGTVMLLRRQLPGVHIVTHELRSLFHASALPFSLSELPTQFTPFRKAVEELPVPDPLPAPKTLPPPPRIYFRELPELEASESTTVRGGAGAAHAHLRDYLFAERAVATYKQTRDALAGRHSSSRLSAWLANGCLSPRQLVQQLRLFEQTEVRNESTYWLFFELLWREFFYWRALQDGRLLFAPYGVARRKRLCCFDPRAFARWCAGDTPWPLVNALMHELVATGWMSNRGRQIVASALVYDLGVDWRYGEAFFEKHLIDYDVASNYGNWQYVAGVGCDPRGGRHFNIEKQTAIYDPDGEFIQRWDGERPAQMLHAVDAADWPLEPDGL